MDAWLTYHTAGVSSSSRWSGVILCCQIHHQSATSCKGIWLASHSCSVTCQSILRFAFRIARAGSGRLTREWAKLIYEVCRSCGDSITCWRYWQYTWIGNHYRIHPTAWPTWLGLLCVAVGMDQVAWGVPLWAGTWAQRLHLPSNGHKQCHAAPWATLSWYRPEVDRWGNNGHCCPGFLLNPLFPTRWCSVPLHVHPSWSALAIDEDPLVEWLGRTGTHRSQLFVPPLNSQGHQAFN